MARVQIHTVGSKKNFAPMTTNIHFNEVGSPTSPHVFRNQLLTRLAGAQTDISTEEYLVLWNAEDEPYSSVLTGVITQISRKGVNRVAIHHGPGMDNIVRHMNRTKLQSYALSLAKKLVTRFEHMTIRLSFSRGDSVLPKLLDASIKQLKAIIAEA